MPTLIIGNKNYSSWSLRPWLVLRHLGLDFEEVRLSLGSPDFHRELKRYSQAGRVPVYQDDQGSIWDSLAICEFLAERNPLLWPDEPYQRALARAYVCEMHSGFTALRAELPMNCRALQRQIEPSQAALADIARIEQIWQQCIEHHAQEGPWLFGRFGIIDAFFAPVAIRFNGYQLSLAHNSREYVKLQLSNPLLQEWIAAGQAEPEVILREEVGA
ncbi:glutathione S-transferase family protein [Motiliproteus sp.]|uniref:glutathione S-transferase family protein n=1 Tax=Motiliproteus sp. TaxID=1898955 RepID=UPI003BAB8890